jgi:hypothetical protein
MACLQFGPIGRSNDEYCDSLCGGFFFPSQYVLQVFPQITPVSQKFDYRVLYVVATLHHGGDRGIQ